MSDITRTTVTPEQLDRAVEALGLTPPPGIHLIRLVIEHGSVHAEYAAMKKVSRD